MGYTTDIDTMELIFQNKTLRSSSLTNARLNDPMEKERIGIEPFASSKFITCFCHSDHECVPFWMYYGGKERKNKLLMLFKNFAANFNECIHTDYALVSGDKKCLFWQQEFKNIINKGNLEQYDIRAFINSISMFDVVYVPIESDVFTQDNSGVANIKFSNILNESQTIKNMKVYNSTPLGKNKSSPWDYEKETRILCSLSKSKSTFNGWDYLDLRLKPEIFRDLIIVLSPWDDGTLLDKVLTILKKVIYLKMFLILYK